MQEIRTASKSDKLLTGDYGRLGVVWTLLMVNITQWRHGTVLHPRMTSILVLQMQPIVIVVRLVMISMVTLCYCLVTKMVAGAGFSKSKVRERRGRTLKSKRN